MKKTLLLALSILSTISISSQVIGTHPIDHPVSQRPATQFATTRINPCDIAPASPSGQLVAVDALTTPIRRAVGIQDKYYGTATSNTATVTTWEMTITDNGDDTYTMTNIAPVPTSWASLVPNGFTFTARREGNKIIVEPQPTPLKSTSYDVWFCNQVATENGGRIVFTIGDDGSLTLDEGTQLTYFGVAHEKDFDPTFQDKSVMLGHVYYYKDIEYTFDTPVLKPVAYYEPDFMFLHTGYTQFGQRLRNNCGIMPAFTPLTFTNKSTNADTYHWDVDEVSFNLYTGKYDWVIESHESDDQHFTFTGLGSNIYNDFRLTARGEGGEATYAQSTQHSDLPAVNFAAETAGYFALSDGTIPIIGLANADKGIATFEKFGTSGYTSNNISELIMYQGKTVAPLYCEGINILLYNFEKYAGFRLTCSIYKAHRSETGKLTLGELIAESSKIIEYTQGAPGNSFTELRFTDFKQHNRWGDMVTRDYMFIEDECAIVISGWNNRTFSAVPLGESIQEQVGLPSTYVRLAGSDDILTYSTDFRRMYVGFYWAAYGYLYAPAGVDFQFGPEGGGLATKVYPFLVDGDNGSLRTRIFRDEDYEIPDWIDFGIINEDYKEAEFGGSFDLVYIAKPLPDGVDSRSAEMLLWQEGAKLMVTLTQTRDAGGNGDNDGIATLSTSTSTPTYNLMGQRVSGNARGIVIVGGTKRVITH